MPCSSSRKSMYQPGGAASRLSVTVALNVMKGGLLGATLRRATEGASGRRPTHMMLHAGLDLSRKRLDYCLLDEQGQRVEVGAASPDADGLVGLARRVGESYGYVA